MKLEKKKELIARALGVGKNSVILNTSRLSEIKEAITRQDAKDLLASGAISIKEKKGRKRNQKTSARRRHGSVRKKRKGGKKHYVILTRKLRAYVKKLQTKEKITMENYKQIRKEIRASNFRSLSHLKERITSMGEGN